MFGSQEHHVPEAIQKCRGRHLLLQNVNSYEQPTQSVGEYASTPSFLCPHREWLVAWSSLLACLNQ